MSKMSLPRRALTLARKSAAEAVRLRRDFHAHPEIGHPEIGRAHV